MRTPLGPSKSTSSLWLSSFFRVHFTPSSVCLQPCCSHRKQATRCVHTELAQGRQHLLAAVTHSSCVSDGLWLCSACSSCQVPSTMQATHVFSVIMFLVLVSMCMDIKHSSPDFAQQSPPILKTLSSPALRPTMNTTSCHAQASTLERWGCY